MIEREVPNFLTTRRSPFDSSKHESALKKEGNVFLTNATSARCRRVKEGAIAEGQLPCISKDETIKVKVELASCARLDPSENGISSRGDDACERVRDMVVVETSGGSPHRYPHRDGWMSRASPVALARMFYRIRLEQGWSQLVPAARPACDPEPDIGFLLIFSGRKRLGGRAGVRYWSCSKLTSHACGSGGGSRACNCHYWQAARRRFPR